MSDNQLGQSASPYLLQYKDGPVNWRVWGAAAFAEAEVAGKPVLLSIGYTACHWCHVLKAESFSDPETATMINDNFIPVLVDRQERPDIDSLYQAAAHALGHSGGWPLNLALNAKGQPYFACGYLPKVEAPGQPAFKAVLGSLITTHAEKQSDIAATIDRLMQAMDLAFNRDLRPAAANISLDVAALRVGQRFDIFFGGATGTMKFPNVPLVEYLWRSYLRSGSPQLLQLVTTTLDNMLMGGLYDHLGGGFFRYTADERWMRPHFEKMLYDSALFIDLMTSMWQYNRNGLCKGRIEQTIDWLLRDMKNGDAFAASMDSDSEGEDGKYYLWTEAEIDAALKGTFASRFKTVYNITAEGTYSGGRNVLHRLNNTQGQLTEADEALLAKQRERMLAARDKRAAPMRDDKVLADWNGLVIAALTNAGAVFDRSDWIQAAIKAFDFIVAAMGDGERLAHSWIDGKRGASGFADDYANMARAALQLWEATGDKRFIEPAKNWVRVLNEHFWDGAKGGYNFTSDDAEPLFLRIRLPTDQAAPTANGVMLTVLTRLWVSTADNDYGNRAASLLQAFSADANRNIMSYGSYMNGFEALASGLQIVVIGPRNNLRTHELARVIWSKSLPNRLLMVLAPDDVLPEGHPVHGKTMLNDQPTVYICQRGRVAQPVTDPAILDQMLQLPPGILQQQQQQRRAG